MSWTALSPSEASCLVGVRDSEGGRDAEVSVGEATTSSAWFQNISIILRRFNFIKLPGWFPAGHALKRACVFIGLFVPEPAPALADTP